MFLKGKGKEEFKIQPRLTAASPLGGSRWGPPPWTATRSNTCRSEEAASTGPQPARAAAKTRQHPGQLSVLGESARKQAKPCNLLSPALFSYISLNEVQKQNKTNPQYI